MKRISITRICISILLMLFVSNAFSQENPVKNINQLNSKGEREGFWVENGTYWKREKYYKDGVLSGIYKEYNPRGRLLLFGEYQNGKRCGTWYYFDATGVLIMLFKNFSKNTASIINEADKKKFIPDYKCYSIGYYPNGNIQDEGALLWSEGEAPESDFSTQYGLWKYYDENGKLIKTKVFK